MKISINNKKICVSALFVVTIFFTIIPIVQSYILLKNNWEGVIPEYIDDDLYYYARIKEVTDGHPFIGNPYFMEYRDVKSVAFFVPDWIASILVMLGVPLIISVIINFICWSLIFVGLIYILLSKLNLPPPISALIALISFLEVYWIILRPVVMQEVFPFFIFFILALVLWLKKPRSLAAIIVLIAGCTFPFYIYTYLWQITTTIIGILLAYMFIQKRWLEFKIILSVIAGTILFSLPVLIYTFFQTRALYYWETVSRIGLVESHLPTIYAYQYGRWVVIIIILYFFIKKKTSYFTVENNYIFLIATCSGLGIIILSVSNLITGKELETAQHIGRFITLWISIFFPLALWILFSNKKDLVKQSKLTIFIPLLIILLCLGFMASNLRRSIPFKKISSNKNNISIQAYYEPINWISTNESNPVVIWADEGISTYIPILSKNYVLWHPAGGLHLMPTKEVEDRFLLSRIGTSTADEIYSRYREFEGAGAIWRLVDINNKRYLGCLLFKKCTDTKSEEISGTYISDLLNRQTILKKDLSNSLRFYGVKYIISDISKNEDKYFISIGAKESWKNNRFIVYKIN